MIESLKIRGFIILAVLLLAIVWVAPNILDTEKVWWPSQGRMILGLDIQGGSHLVLRVDVDSAIKQNTQRLSSEIAEELKQENISFRAVSVSDPERGGLRVELNQAADAGAVTGYLEKTYGGQYGIVETTDQAVAIESTELYLRDYKSRLVEQAIATIRNRIDEFGVSEPSITAQGSDRILVQLPGIKDAAAAKELINRTARLDFMMVSTELAPDKLEELIQQVETEGSFKFSGMTYSAYIDKLNEFLKGKIPENTIVYFEKPDNAVTMEAGRMPYLLQLSEVVTGDRLTNAQVGLDEFGRPVVHFRFDAVGARAFAELTRKNVDRQMAIVLDRVVKSAPSINEPITQGSGQITLGRGRDQNETLNEAKIISTALRAGALPATLEQLEERTVGPSLGRDAIEKGKTAATVAAVAVFLFMILYYRSFGFIADVALAFNIFIVIAVLSSLGATLTLPGVAGLALTIGMSVDASVIIYERIREELSKGASLVAAIREGYGRAFSSIFDANVTSIAVCLILMYYGTGPVRGFAITLLTGLVVTMFTAIFFTRTVLDLMVIRWKWKLTPGV